MRDRYARFYSVSRIRSLAYERRGTAHTDLYESLKVLFLKLRDGYEPLGIPGMGSFLFSDDSTPDLDDALLANQDLLDAFRNLCYTEDTSGRGGSYRRPVDFGNLGSEELGSVYESLLELHPKIETDDGPFTLGSAAGNERKTSGSYYTPTSLINCLLDSALDPVVHEAIDVRDPVEAEQRLLALRVCDPACGSGHFLIAAAERMAMHLARVRTGDDQPNTLEVQHAKRDIIGRCIYGVDINPMSVELCKVSLWMEALEPGRALSFLDHHIQCGNSLLGTTPALLARGIPDNAFKPIEGDVKALASDLKKQNKKERKDREKGQGNFEFEPYIKLGNLPGEFTRLSSTSDDSVADVTEKERRYAELVSRVDYQNARLLADTWCAVFVWQKDTTDLGKLCPTENDFRRIENNPHSILPHVKSEVRRLADQYQFFHWHLAFPDVFRLPGQGTRSENDQTGWDSGFDVILGNPPWDQIQLDPQEFFAAAAPDIAALPTMSARNKAIKKLVDDDPPLHAKFVDAQRFNDGIKHFLHQSRRFPLTSVGRLNTAPLFAELFRHTTGTAGRAGLIIPTGIATDSFTQAFFRDLIESADLASLFDFENRNIFPEVHSSYKFCLLTLRQQSKGEISTARFAFFLHEVAELVEPDRVFDLTAADLALLNPNTRTCPIFRTARDAELTKAIYRRCASLSPTNEAVLIRDATGNESERTPWGLKFKLMFMMNTASHLFRTREQLEAAGYKLEGNVFRIRGEVDFLPLYEAKMFHQFNHRWASAETCNENPNVDCSDPTDIVMPRYWVSKEEVKGTVDDTSVTSYVAYRWIARTTDERTCISTVLPFGGFGNSSPILIFEKPTPHSFLLGSLLSSFACDYVVRQKLGGANLTFGTMKQVAVPTQRTLDHISVFLSSCVLELTYTAWDLEAFALDCGYAGPPFRWDEERRFLLRCELDAAYFHLYLGPPAEWGTDSPQLREMFPTPRDAVDYIMETFPIVKRKDIKRTEIKNEKAEVTTPGTYITKDTILTIYDQMQQAIETGELYQTRLNPPPGPPTDAEGNFIPFARWTKDLNTSHIHPPREAVVSTPRPLVVDPVFPGTDLDKVLCACLLDFAQAESGLTEDQNLDKVILAMQSERCRTFLTGDDKSQYDQSLSNVSADLIADSDGKPQWQLLLSSLLGNGSLVKIGDGIGPGKNFDAVRPNLPEVDGNFLSLVAKAAERFRELSEAHETDDSTQSVIQEVQQQHAAAQAGARN